MIPKSREEFQRWARIRTRLARASFQLEMAELERVWAIVSAHRQGLSVRDIAQQVGLGPTRVHQLVTSPQADCVEHPLSMLREVGWPAPEDPLPDAEEQVADRLTEEATMLISCVGWLESLAAGETPAVNLRPADDLPEACYLRECQQAHPAWITYARFPMKFCWSATKAVRPATRSTDTQ